MIKLSLDARLLRILKKSITIALRVRVRQVTDAGLNRPNNRIRLSAGPEARTGKDSLKSGWVTLEAVRY